MEISIKINKYSILRYFYLHRTYVKRTMYQMKPKRTFVWTPKKNFSILMIPFIGSMMTNFDSKHSIQNEEVSTSENHTHTINEINDHSNFIDHIKQMYHLMIRLFKLYVLTGPLLLTLPIPFYLNENNIILNVWWKYAIWCTCKLNATTVKFFQWAATRRDLFPATFCDHFQILHMNGPRHDWNYTEKLFIKHFGENYTEIFKIDTNTTTTNDNNTINETMVPLPIGSGCIAQVYSGTFLKNNQQIILKVIHPNIKKDIKNDIILLKIISKLLYFIIPSTINYLSIQESIDEFSNLMLNQVNLKKEGENLIRFKNNFKNKRKIKFPTPLMEYTTEDILVETLEEGKSVSSILNHTISSNNNKICKDVARIGLKYYLEMLFIHNFAHGDLHPGNFFINIEENRYGKKKLKNILLIDAGIVTELEKNDLKNFIHLFHAVAKKDGLLAGTLIVKYSKNSNEITKENKEKFCNAMKDIVDNAIDHKIRLRDVHVGKLLNDVMNICCLYNVKLESRYVSVVLSIGILEGLGRNLDPDLDILSMSLPIITKSRLFNMI